MRLLFCAFLVSLTVLGASGPPNPYVDKGACPFEGCTYREWVAKREVRLFDRPSGTRKVGMVRAGERVAGLTGEVHSVPVLVHARENIPNPEKPGETAIPRGEPFYVLHYLGEGYWLSWYKGTLVNVENFSDAGPFPKSVWWVKVKTGKGLVAWAVSDGNFEGQDRLA